MPMVLMVISVRDHETLSRAWRAARGGHHPSVRRRMGLRGRSSLLRELILWGFERASEDPDQFLRFVRDSRDPMLDRADGRRDPGSARRQDLLESWSSCFEDGGARRGKARRGATAPGHASPP